MLVVYPRRTQEAATMTTLQKKHAIAAFAALSLATALAGCAADASVDTGTDTDTDTGTDSAPAESGTYADGTYTESGNYTAPSGTETVEVTVTLADGTITDVKVVGDATDPQAKIHQGEFIGGIADEVVGKSLDELDVSKVSGSSLTSQGFNQAIEQIKADATA